MLNWTIYAFIKIKNREIFLEVVCFSMVECFLVEFD